MSSPDVPVPEESNCCRSGLIAAIMAGVMRSSSLAMLKDGTRTAALSEMERRRAPLATREAGFVAVKELAAVALCKGWSWKRRYSLLLVAFSSLALYLLGAGMVCIACSTARSEWLASMTRLAIGLGTKTSDRSDCTKRRCGLYVGRHDNESGLVEDL